MTQNETKTPGYLLVLRDDTAHLWDYNKPL